MCHPYSQVRIGMESMFVTGFVGAHNVGMYVTGKVYSGVTKYTPIR